MSPATLPPTNFVQLAFAQQAEGLTGGELTVLFGGFVVAVVGLVLFLARDVILGRKTRYDSEEYDSKRDRTYEKYHSGWTDDYEDVGSRDSNRDLGAGQLPDYYKILGVPRDATRAEIKRQYRSLAKREHPDRAGGSAKDAMAKINRAYEVLSDAESRSAYDRQARRA